MSQNSGNFLLQTLLALSLVFAFMPFVTSRLALRDNDAKMYSATEQVSVAQTAARIYVRENLNALQYDTTVISGQDFSDTLEPYGLPFGFVPRNAFGQDISLIIFKNFDGVTAYLRLSGGNLSTIELAELARRIGFYATMTQDSVLVGLALNDTYSEIVYRNNVGMEDSAFLTNLDMGGFSIENTNALFARLGELETAEIGTLNIIGSENGRKEKNKFKNITANRAVFQNKTGEAALSLTRGVFSADTVSVRTISQYGNTGNLTVDDAAMYNFSMTAGRTGFYGPEQWNVHGDVLTNNITFSVDQLNIGSYINASRGQDVYIDSDTLTYSTQSGISVEDIYVSNITLRDQTSSSLSTGGNGAMLLEIRPGGTSTLPDALVNTINNDNINILRKPSGDSDDKDSCKSIIQDIGETYNSKSLTDYILCQYLYWVRLEQRINIKQCMLDGKSDCE